MHVCSVSECVYVTLRVCVCVSECLRETDPSMKVQQNYYILKKSDLLKFSSPFEVFANFSRPANCFFSPSILFLFCTPPPSATTPPLPPSQLKSQGQAKG